MKQGRMTCIFLLVISAFTAAAALTASAPAAFAPAANAATPDSWVSDPNLAASLAPEVKIGQYSIRPPAGYTLHQTPSDPAEGIGVTYAWIGPRNADGTNPIFSVDSIVTSGRKTRRLTSGDCVRQGLSLAQQSHTRVVLSPITSGRVNGLPFARAAWSGVGLRTGKMFHGILYGRVAPPLRLTISGKDEEPAGARTLPVFEAAALTLRKP